MTLYIYIYIHIRLTRMTLRDTIYMCVCHRFIVRFPMRLDCRFKTFFLHFFSVNFSPAISAFTFSTHKYLDLPTGLIPSTLISIFYFTYSPSFFLISCPYHLSVPLLITVMISPVSPIHHIPPVIHGNATYRSNHQYLVSFKLKPTIS